MERIGHELTLLLGILSVRLISEVPLIITDEVRAFCTDTGDADITVQVRVMREEINLPQNKIGEDLLLEYYYDNGYYFAAAKHGTRSSAAVTVHTPDFSDAVFYINEEEFPGMIRRVSKILQLFPVRQMLAERHAVILHSSRILLNGKTIIFTAPSQTGKTTQAKLWEQVENAEIVSNDRTLLQKERERFSTCGYPVDGSEPVYCSRSLPLGAVVVLRQGAENRIERLTVRKALKYLMEQTVADAWNAEQLAILRTLWMNLMEQYPVYQLTCTPDQRAVRCLKEQLERDGVMPNGSDQRQTL